MEISWMELNYRSNPDEKIGKSVNNDQAISKFDHQPDQFIWQEFLNGNESALVYIYHKYSQVLFNYAGQFTRNTDLVSDCIQDLFADLIRTRHKLGSTNSIKFYLFRSLRRRVVRQLKKNEQFTFQDPWSEGNKSFEIDLDDNQTMVWNQKEFEELKITLKETCNQLPTRQKEAIILYFYEGFSYEQISELMNFSKTKSARKLIYRALDNLASKFDHFRLIGDKGISISGLVFAIFLI